MEYICQEERIQFTKNNDENNNGTHTHPIVYIGYDTRPSSIRLANAAIQGVETLSILVSNAGLLSTPQLHHIVRINNQPLYIPSLLALPSSTDTGSALSTRYNGEEGYYNMLYDGFLGVVDTESSTVSAGLTASPLVLDCANGVGANKAVILAEKFKAFLAFTLRNTGSTPETAALLNEHVGAEHAQKEKQPPTNFHSVNDANQRCASLDGDADRIVYHYFDNSSKHEWHLLDGDKIACLAAFFIGKLLEDAGLQITDQPTHTDDHHHHPSPSSSSSSSSSVSTDSLRSSPISVGIVQTAYANGASTNYITSQLKLPVVRAKTGVKYVHHAATVYDIGVYFEANGHGTVIFHPEFIHKLIRTFENNTLETLTTEYTVKGVQALRRLFWSTFLINQAIGDALSDMLLVETILILYKWDIGKWDNIYTDLPSRQKKLPVKDRTLIKVNTDETRILDPIILQNCIDEYVNKVPLGRAFLRPSGTEDVVRVYAEGETQEQADTLADQVINAAKLHAGGV